MKLSHMALIACTCLLAYACAPQTKIASKKATDYSAEAKRIFVVTDVGTDFGNEFGDAFQNKLTAIAESCGAVMQVDRISSLELDEDVHLKKMKEFDANVLMSVRRNGGTKNQYGLFQVYYDVRLVDIALNKTVYRANVDFSRGPITIPLATRGEALAVDITNKMKEDGIVHGCPVIKPNA